VTAHFLLKVLTLIRMLCPLDGKQAMCDGTKTCIIFMFKSFSKCFIM